MRNISIVLIVFGILLILSGLLLRHSNLLSFLGRLPGDIRIKKDNFSFYFPITTMLLISVILNILIRIFTKK